MDAVNDKKTIQTYNNFIMATAVGCTQVFL